MNLLDTTQLSAKLGLTIGAFKQLRARDKSFPRPILVSQRVLRWDEQDINQWLNQKKESVNGESIGA